MAINMADKAMNEVLKDVKIGTPLEKKWTDTRDKIKESIMVDKINLKLAEASLIISEEEIKKEKLK